MLGWKALTRSSSIRAGLASRARIVLGYTPAADLLATLRGDPCALQSVLAVEMDPAAGLLPPRPGQGPMTVRSVAVDVGGSTAPGVAIAGTGATPWFMLEPPQRSGVLPVVVNVAGGDDGVSVMFARGTEVLARMPVPGGDGAPDRRLLAPSGADSVRLEVNAPAHGIGAVSLPRAPVLTPMTQVLPPGTQAILDWPAAFVFPCLEPAPLPLGTAALPRWRVAPPSDDPSAGITYTRCRNRARGFGSVLWGGQWPEQGFDRHADCQNPAVAVHWSFDVHSYRKAAGGHAAGSERLGTPAQLPGPMLRMVVANVSTGGPPSTDIVPEPFTGSMGAGRTGQVGNIMTSTRLVVK